jgi:hypothetical protein
MAEELTAPDSETTVNAAVIQPVLPEGATQDTEDLNAKPLASTPALDSNAYGGCVHSRAKQEQTVYYTN